MSNEVQQWFSLGIGGALISLVGYSIWKLIGAWMAIAGTERESSTESRTREAVMQTKLNEEIAKRVALEVEVKYLHREIAELKARLEHVERMEENDSRH